MRKPLVAGNWKMNGNTAYANLLSDELKSVSDDVDVVVFPPSPYLSILSDRLSGCSIGLGAQNLSEHCSGAYTGELSAEILADVGCKYVLIGHSERRQYFSEAGELLAAKVKRALEQDLIPVLCVGETLAQREDGDALSTVVEQALSGVRLCSKAELDRVIFAYEPVWAIGTGKTASPDQAQEVHAGLRAALSDHFGCEVSQSTRILYGGSVNAANAADIFAKTDIDGGLIGGASLKSEDFLAIVAAAAATK